MKSLELRNRKWGKMSSSTEKEHQTCQLSNHSETQWTRKKKKEDQGVSISWEMLITLSLELRQRKDWKSKPRGRKLKTQKHSPSSLPRCTSPRLVGQRQRRWRSWRHKPWRKTMHYGNLNHTTIIVRSRGKSTWGRVSTSRTARTISMSQSNRRKLTTIWRTWGHRGKRKGRAWVPTTTMFIRGSNQLQISNSSKSLMTRTSVSMSEWRQSGSEPTRLNRERWWRSRNSEIKYQHPMQLIRASQSTMFTLNRFKQSLAF